MKKGTLSLVPIQEQRENEQKQPWERMDGEPAQWFLRFKAYCLLGRGRSLQALVAQERGLLTSAEEDEKAPEGTENEKMFSDVSPHAENETHFDDLVQRDQARRREQNATVALVKRVDATGVTVPGAWKRACKRWSWVVRSQAWD